jgi:hypothetical protein
MCRRANNEIIFFLDNHTACAVSRVKSMIDPKARDGSSQMRRFVPRRAREWIGMEFVRANLLQYNGY